jgi:hypothetical protein
MKDREESSKIKKNDLQRLDDKHKLTEAELESARKEKEMCQIDFKTKVEDLLNETPELSDTIMNDIRLKTKTALDLNDSAERQRKFFEALRVIYS